MSGADSVGAMEHSGRHTPLLSIRGLRKEFGGLVAVSDFNLDLGAGQLVGLIGPNGSGKTTVFNCVTGIYKPTAGRVMLGGTDVTGLGPDRIARRGIARTFQNIRLFRSLSVIDNVKAAFHPRLRSSIVSAALHLPGCMREEREIEREALQLLEEVGLVPHRDAQAGSLPYGLQRRLEIARALATRPRVLLLDEPAAGMTPEEVRNLMDFILNIRDRFGLSIFLIEHHVWMVTGICPWIIVIDHGVTIARGTPDEIQKDPRVIEAYLGTEDAGVA